MLKLTSFFIFWYNLVSYVHTTYVTSVSEQLELKGWLVSTPYKKKSRRRIALASITLFLIGIGYAGIVTVITRDSTLPDPRIPIVQAPTLEQLDLAIASSERYLDGMYKEVTLTDAVQSEYYAMPLRALFPHTNTWSLLGQNNTSSIEAGPSDKFSEQFKVSFNKEAFVAIVQLNWNEAKSLQIVVRPQAVRETTELWLGSTLIGKFRADVASTAVSVDVTDFSTLASLRYTVRHATQQALFYWQLRGDQAKVEKLRHFLVANRYEPGYDMRAIIFNQSAGLPDDLPYDRRAYQDCDHLPPTNLLAYPYESKACTVLGVYFAAGERDPFLQATFALHMLQKYKDPKRQYKVSSIEEIWLQSNTPEEASQHLRQQWERTHVGIPSCTPVECQSVASGIRTFAFGALEAELGYNYGDEKARWYADAAAVSTLNAQITTGTIRMTKGDIYRPVYTGGFIAYWDNKGYFRPPDASILGALVLTLIDESAMPPEYLGVIPSNSETAFDGWAFLVRYRCLKYGVKCYPAS